MADIQPYDVTPIPSPEGTEDTLMPATHEELEMALGHAQRHKSLPQYLKTKDAKRAFQSAFELIGGIPRLALWADKNPDKFYPLYARFLDSSSGAPPAIQLNLSWMHGRNTAGSSDVEFTENRGDVQTNEESKA